MPSFIPLNSYAAFFKEIVAILFIPKTEQVAYPVFLILVIQKMVPKELVLSYKTFSCEQWQWFSRPDAHSLSLTSGRA